MKLFPVSIIFITIQKLLSQPFEEAISSHKDHFMISGPADDNADHEIVIAVNQLNIGELKRIVERISDPSDKEYGRHMSREELGYFTENKIAVESINKHLRGNGVVNIRKTLYGEYIIAKAPIQTWSKIFNTKFYKFEHIDGDFTIFRAMHYSLPVEWKDHVLFVLKMTQFPPPRVKKQVELITTLGQTISSQFDGYLYPAYINSFYGVTTNTGSSQATQCVYATAGQIFSPTDLAGFQNEFNLPVQPITTSIGGHVDGTACSNSANLAICEEANFDVQYLMAVSQSSPTTFWYGTRLKSIAATTCHIIQ